MDLQTLRFNRNKLLTDMAAISEKPWTTESRAAFDTMNTEVATLESDIQRTETLAAYDAANNSYRRSAGRGTPGADAHGEQTVEQRKKAFSQAFSVYARDGRAALNTEQRALLTTSDATGGAFIPQLFDGAITDALKFYGPIATKVRQKVTDKNGAPLKISLANDTANGLTLLATEGTSSPAETDPTLQSKLLGVDTVSGGLIKISVQELEDSAFDFDALIRDYFGKRYGRGVETAITLGVDSASTTLPNQSTGGIVGAATAGTTTAHIADGIGWSDLTAAFTALDPAYINANTAWVMNSTTRGYLVGLKDGFGRPYFTPDPSEDAPFSKILGYNIVLNQAMANVGSANAVPILFGDLQSAYMLRTDGQPSILRLNERYMDTLEVGFMLFTRIGGISLNAGVSPLVKITQAAS